MATGRRWVGLIAWAVLLNLISWHAGAISLDSQGDLKFGVRTYTNARIGTEDTKLGVPNPRVASRPPSATNPIINYTSATYPYSAAGHLRQNRFFLEAELNHKLDHLVNEGVGPLSLLSDLPFRITGLGYNVTFRGEYDGIYDWGPREYRTADEFEKVRRLQIVVPRQVAPDVAAIRHRLRDVASHRERLFQAYIEGTVDQLFVRLGRQVISWGETDAFQLIDRINPLDASFGGFLVPLDERRVPLDMLRTQYRLGEIGPLTEVFLEGYVAIDNRVGFDPAIPPGSPWSLPGFGAGRTETRSFTFTPSRTVKDARAGARLLFNAGDATFSLAYLSTYFDTPAGQLFTTPGGVLVPFDEGLQCPDNPNQSNCGSPTHAFLTPARTQVFGATTSFALPQLYSVVRSEAAYFKDEPAFTQYQFDPFIFSNAENNKTTGGRRLRDSINLVLGIDSNVRIRFLNPDSTFFVTTQFFYKHIKNAAGSRVFNEDGSLNPDREVLPIIDNLIPAASAFMLRVEPLFVSQPRDSFLQTLAVGTSYDSGRINPFAAVFYDWGGALVYQPGVTFVRDPFRFSMSYSILDAHHYKGGSGVSLLRDRDNVEVRLEYVI